MKGVFMLMLGAFLAITIVLSLSVDIADTIQAAGVNATVASFSGLPEVLGLLPLLFIAVPIIGLARVIR